METMILLEFNKNEFDSLHRKLIVASSDMQKAVDQLNNINSFKLDDRGLRDIIYSNGELVANRIERCIDDDLTSSGTKSPTLRQLAKKGDLEAFYSILKRFPKPDAELRVYLSINEEGAVEVSPKAEQFLREACSQYIKTERGLAIYQAQEKVILAMNELATLCPKLAGRQMALAWNTNLGSSPFESAKLNYDGL